MFLRVTKKHQGTGSLNESLGSERDGTELVLGDIITSDEPDPVEIVQHKILMRKLVEKMRERLNEREFKIINLRYGIENQIALPQREVAKELGISRSYISRIEKQAIEIIKEIVKEDEFLGALDS